jgi:hypothetical protein
MAALPHLSSRRERGAALIIVLAFAVLLTGVMVAFLSRTTSDRQVAQVSLTQTKVDQVAASGMDLVIGGLRQEITGPSPTPTPPYVPAANSNMVPLRFDNPPGSLAAIPNLVRRSVRADNTIPAPGVPSYASAVNSTTDVSANGRFITLPRWNKHYLVPKSNTGDAKTDPTGEFVAPDWVIVTRAPRNPTDPTSPYPVAFSTWDPTLADQTPTNNLYAVGRYAYAIYDEGQLLDANVAGYPTGTTADQSGRKGPVAFADLTDPTLPYPIPQTQIDKLVGWRNYGSELVGASNATIAAFGTFPNFTFTAALATNYVNNFVLFNTTGFSRANGVSATNGRTDQMFLSRQQLIAYRATGNLFNVNTLQYLGTFLRELNAPSWKPSTPAGSSIDYAALANNATAINRDLLNVRVPAGSPGFTRADGSSASAGDLLIKQRFPLSRINGLGPTGANTAVNSTILNGFLVPATDPNSGGGTISRDFGLHWNSDHWDYVGATGTTVQTAIKTLDQVATDNREPNFFELLKAGILSGSVGIGSNGATFVAAEAKYYNTNPATPPTSSDYQIMQIGANIIDQWDSDNIPTFINFGGNELAGIENLPYLNKLVFKPAWTTIKGTGHNPDTYRFDAWLLPSLWNPHQNAASGTGNVRIAMTAGTMTATLSGGPLCTSVTGSLANPPSMIVDPTKFTTPTSPSGVTAAALVSTSGAVSASSDLIPGPYNGFHVNSQTNPTTPPSNSSTAYPVFTACQFAMQVQVNGNWKSYQKWTGCAQPATPLACAPSSWLGVTTYQDPEFVTLDPRTVRFGAWGNAANQSTIAADYTDGTQGTLDWPAPAPGPRFERITALPPVGASFSSPASPNLYLYAKNDDGTVHYTDLDTIQRRGDIISGSTTPMLPTDFVDRPRILNRPFQSVAELGQVFRDQPWKTLDFGDFVSTTVPGADAGLLDVFTLHESANEAGKTSLNTRYKFILTAILSKATTSLTNTATVITSAQRDAIVTDLFNITSAQPMIRKTDLLRQLATKASVTGLGNKEARELVIRAFSDACQTRTWNLLIDVIAQSGRYPTNASTLAGFLVDGEQHYWVHVAIDRFTGQVIDKQIEVVNE